MDDNERLRRRELISALREKIVAGPKYDTGIAAIRSKIRQDERRQALATFMNDNNLKANSWAEQAGVRPTSVYNFINGHSKSMDDETYEKLAEFMGVTAATLMGEPDYSPAVGQALVIGRVQAGSWQKAVTFIDEADTTVVPCVLPDHLAAKGTRVPVFGLSVVGDSMDEIFPEGTVLICLPFQEMSGPVADGDFVVVHRINPDGLYEATCKQYRLVDGEVFLAPRSTNPRHEVIMGDATDGSQVEVAAIVFGHYSPTDAASRL